jgi:hypothetical protein
LTATYRFDEHQTTTQRLYDDNVQRYMNVLTIMERVNDQKLPPITASAAVKEEVSVNKASFVKVKDIIKHSTNIPAKADHVRSKSTAKKAVPRYMQANQAWLSKDKQSESRGAVTNQHSRRGSMMPRPL